MALDLSLGNKCNNNCLMCTNPSSPWPAWDGSYDYDYDSIVSRLKKKKKDLADGDSIYLTGGEPTLHPGFLDILKYLSVNFPKQEIKLLTNGRRFCYKNFTREFLSINSNIKIEMSLYGPFPQIHDSVTRTPDSFRQTFLGLKNLLKNRQKNQTVSLRFVLTKKSYKHIKDFLILMEKEFPFLNEIIIIFMEYEGQALVNKGKVAITYAEVEPYLEESFSLIESIGKVKLYHFPLCVLGEDFWPYCWKTWPREEVTLVSACQKCPYENYCVGIHKEYLKNVGSSEFYPPGIKRKAEVGSNPYKPIDKVI